MAALTELSFLEALRRRHPAGDRTVIGIGDDCAALAPLKADERLLVTSDLLTEGIDFEWSWASPQVIGWKAVAVNVSDLAAMGGWPIGLTWAVAIPAPKKEALWDLAAGVEAACAEFSCPLVGGDTSAAVREVTLSLTALGAVKETQVVRRSGAKPGDQLYCSGTIGDAGLGLALLQARKGVTPGSATDRDFLLGRFWKPTPRLELGRRLGEGRLASAMIDISDGLLLDLSRLLQASGVDAFLEPEAIPLSSALRASGTGIVAACTSGEDYELLFTAPPERRGEVERLPNVVRIGEIRARQGAETRIEGPQKDSWPKAGLGFEHF